ncbi:MAG: DNA-protecting protein DprA [Blastopirellula sp.]|nr:MAG: DNA-protecting protein DprA [Blastopirellula sp.]
MSSENDAKYQDPEFRAQLRLALISGVGPRTNVILLEYFGSCEAILAASNSQLQQVTGVGPKLANKIVKSHEIDIDREIDLCRDFGIKILTRKDDLYPHLLQEIPDPPNIIFVRGDLLPCDSMSVAIVGTRHATSYGLRQAERFAFELSKAGFTIVSGLARGIDGAAHRGALKAEGRTIAFLAGGVCSIYPPEHDKLAEQVVKNGALISEAAPLMKPMAGAFPQRNRLITGMSLGTVVVEAATRSGALISARTANEQGREVFAMPGRIDVAVSHGCHRLIKDGAKLIESVDDIIDELGPLAKPTQVNQTTVIRHPAEVKLNEQESCVLQAISVESTDMDTIVEKSGLPIQRVLSTISVLEMRRLIQRISGTTVRRI